MSIGFRWRTSAVRAIGGEGAARVRRQAEQQAASWRLPLVWPDRLEGGVPSALRAAGFASEYGAGARFALAAARLAFCGGFDLEDPEILAEAAAAAGIPLDPCLAAAGDRVATRCSTPPRGVFTAGGCAICPPCGSAGSLLEGEDALVRASTVLRSGPNTARRSRPLPEARLNGRSAPAQYLLGMTDPVDRAVRAISLRNSYVLVWAQFGLSHVLALGGLLLLSLYDRMSHTTLWELIAVSQILISLDNLVSIKLTRRMWRPVRAWERGARDERSAVAAWTALATFPLDYMRRVRTYPFVLAYLPFMVYATWRLHLAWYLFFVLCAVGTIVVLATVVIRYFTLEVVTRPVLERISPDLPPTSSCRRPGCRSATGCSPPPR